MKLKQRKINSREQEQHRTPKEFFKENWKNMVVMAGAFIITLLLVAWKSTKVPVVNFNINAYEVGQVADITIKSPIGIPETDEYPGITKGEVIVKNGFQISEDAYSKMLRISELDPEFNPRPFFNDIIFILIVAMISIFLFSKRIIGKKIEFKETLMASIFLILCYGATVAASLSTRFSSPYAISVIVPSSLCVFLMCILFGSIDGVYYSLIQSLFVLNGSGMEIVPFLYIFITSLFAVYIVRSIKNRLQLVSSGIVIALMNCLVMMLLKIVRNDFFTGQWYVYAELAFNGFMSAILTLGFVTPLEYILNTPTVFRLMDLSDRNNDILQKLFISANGTYQHSEMVAQLAEDGCRAIGANALVARVAALYHDIGKMERPEYFTENQSAEQGNKHNEINPSLSVTIIKDHLKRSVDLAREMHMPESIVKMISEHHGNQVIKFFYEKAKEKDPSVTPEDYSYPGNPPSTRESAILMLADTAEAACRSLQNPTAQRIDKFISTLISAKYESGQLESADLTFRDLEKIKAAFVQVLTGFYHSRVQYPGQKDPDSKEAQTQTSQIQLAPSANSQTAENTAASVQEEKKEVKAEEAATTSKTKTASKTKAASSKSSAAKSSAKSSEKTSAKSSAKSSEKSAAPKKTSAKTKAKKE